MARACKLICTFQLLHVFVILIQCFLNVQQNAVTKSIGDGRPLNLLVSIHEIDLQKSSLHFIGRFCRAYEVTNLALNLDMWIPSIHSHFCTAKRSQLECTVAFPYVLQKAHRLISCPFTQDRCGSGGNCSVFTFPLLQHIPLDSSLNFMAWQCWHWIMSPIEVSFLN